MALKPSTLNSAVMGRGVGSEILNTQQVVEPAELQVKIDELVSKVENGRCFVRPSGTGKTLNPKPFINGRCFVRPSGTGKTLNPKP